jgi:4-hydroxybenzoate polyprenyltransferase
MNFIFTPAFKYMNSHAIGFIPEQFDPFRITGRIWQRIVGLYDFLVFSALLLCFECIAMAYISCAIQDLPWDPMLALIPFFVAFSIYNLNRKTDEDEDAVNRQDRFAFTKRYEAPLYYGALLFLGLALVLSALSGIPSLLATAAPFILGTLYSFRLLPEGLGYRRLKEIPAVKNITVGLAWGILLSFLPVFFWHREPGTGTMITFLLFFMWGFMASVIPDIRDRAGDARADVRTIPVIFGKQKTKRILTGVLILLGIPVVTFSLFLRPLSATMIVVAANIYSHGCVALLDREGLIHFVADFISDGQYIFFASAMVIFTALHLGY